MNVETFCRHLEHAVAAAWPEQRLETLAGELALFFRVDPHEVGLFKLETDGRMAVFVWPPHRMDTAIKIPVSSFTTSLISATARQRQGSIDNAFASTRHLHMFEHALTDKEHCVPLQKVMTAPAVKNDKLVWIVQISRKAKSLSEADPDFTNLELKQLEQIAQTLPDLLL